MKIENIEKVRRFMRLVRALAEASARDRDRAGRMEERDLDYYHAMRGMDRLPE